MMSINLSQEVTTSVVPPSSYRILLRDQDYKSDFFNFPSTILIIEDYFASIPNQIFQLNTNSVSSVEFFKATMFSNIQMTLANFPCLQFVKFSNLSLDQYRRINPKQALTSLKLYAANLLQLNFSHYGDVTKDELIILDYFTKFVKTDQLKSVQFSQKNSFRFEGPLPKLEHNEAMQEHGEHLGPFTLLNFLQKNCSSLKSLKIERHGFSVVPNDPIGYVTNDPNGLVPTEMALQLQQLQFLVDIIGIDIILSSQTQLEQLSCKWHNFCNIIPSHLSNLMSTISNCYRNNPSLVTIEVPGCIQIHPECISEDFQVSSLWTDFHNFKNNPAIQNLLIEEACLLSNTTVLNNQLLLGTFINSQFIPTTLRTLRLIIGHVIEEEFELLTSRFQHFSNLDSCILRSGTPFLISETSFLNILKLPKYTINSVVIYNGNFHKGFQPHQHLTSQSESRGNDAFWKLMISDRWLSLRKDKLAYSFVA